MLEEQAAYERPGQLRGQCVAVREWVGAGQGGRGKGLAARSRCGWVGGRTSGMSEWLSALAQGLDCRRLAARRDDEGHGARSTRPNPAMLLLMWHSRERARRKGLLCCLKGRMVYSRNTPAIGQESLGKESTRRGRKK